MRALCASPQGDYERAGHVGTPQTPAGLAWEQGAQCCPGSQGWGQAAWCAGRFRLEDQPTQTPTSTCTQGCSDARVFTRLLTEMTLCTVEMISSKAGALFLLVLLSWPPSLPPFLPLPSAGAGRCPQALGRAAAGTQSAPRTALCHLLCLAGCPGMFLSPRPSGH